MSKGAVLCHGPKDEYLEDVGDPFVHLYIPLRVAATALPEDLLVLPDDQGVRAFVRFCEAVGVLQPAQTIFVAGHRQVQRAVLPDQAAIARLRAGSPASIAGYAVDESLLSLGRVLGVPVSGDSVTWANLRGHKGILHPRPSGEAFLPPEIVVARGFTCLDRAELARAFCLLREQGVAGMLLKPVYGSAGQGIERVGDGESLSRYEFPLGPVVLEEELVVDRDEPGRVISPSIQYDAGVAGLVTDQVFSGFAHAGNAYPSQTSSLLQTEFREMAQRFLAATQPLGSGGLDAVSVGGRPVIVDVNAARYTGARPGIDFWARHGRAPAFIAWKQVPPAELSVVAYWDRLVASGLAFIPDGSSAWGVFPLGYLPGQYGLFVAMGQSTEQVALLRRRAEELLW